VASDYGDNMLVPELWLNPDGGYSATYAVQPASAGSFVPVQFHQGQMGMLGAAWALERVGPRFVRQVQKGEFVEATLKVRDRPPCVCCTRETTTLLTSLHGVHFARLCARACSRGSVRGSAVHRRRVHLCCGRAWPDVGALRADWSETRADKL
jgi:hypothetical protein